MKKRILSTSLGLAILLGFVVSESWATIILDVDMDITNGTGACDPLNIDSTRVASPGATFPVGICLTTDAAGVSSYSISVDHDITELTFNLGSTESAVLPGGLAAVAPGVTDNAVTGRSSSFDAFTLGAGPASTTFAIGTIDFTVLAGVNSDASGDITPGFFVVGVDGAFDNSMPLGMDLVPTATINPGIVNVPEPSAFGLLLLVGSIVGIGRFCQKRFWSSKK